MRTKFINFLIFSFALSLIISSCNKKETQTLRFLNPLPIERINEVVTISYQDLTNETIDLPSGMLPLFLEGEDTLTSQNIDLNNDGTPEEILVEISIPGSGKKDIRIETVPEELFPVFPLKTNIHFASLASPQTEIDSAVRIQTVDTRVTSSILQMEGPGWENDKLGFRNYYDLRNGMDIFGKVLPVMALDTIGLGKHSYHLMSTWGMDILKVGTSLGAGGIGMEKDGKLFRIGDNGQSGYEKIYEGPLKSEFAFRFVNWKAGKDSFNIIQYISITAGLYRYESEVFADFPDESYKLVTGIVNKHSESLYFDDSCNNHIFLATHSVQTEDTAILGMAILIPRNLYRGHDEAPVTGEGITETYFVRTACNMSDPSRYYFYAGWATGNPLFKYKENFMNLIKEDALKLENPIRVYKVTIP